MGILVEKTASIYIWSYTAPRVKPQSWAVTVHPWFSCPSPHTRWQVRRALAFVDSKVEGPLSLWQQALGSCDNSVCLRSRLQRDSRPRTCNRLAQESRSSFNKLEANDIFRNQKRPCHGLHRNPFWVRLHIELYENLEWTEKTDLLKGDWIKKKNKCSSCAKVCVSDY